jgi:prolyl-tRNA editing enzyme YbaK/EbsC (Cys-tRNA(Pro) deacylase)
MTHPNEIQEQVKRAVQGTGVSFEWIPIDPVLSDTAAFCARYGYPPSAAANTLVIASRARPTRYCVCVVLATTRLDVNHRVKALMNGKVSFASADEMRALTGMEVGAVTPFGLNPQLAVYVDHRVMSLPWIILGAGLRDAKIKVSPEALRRLPAVQVIEALAAPRPEGSAASP